MGTALPSINTVKCDGCGTCVDVCPTNYFKIVNGKATIHALDCVNCSACILACPLNALS
jgi:ferredoxin